MTHQSDHSILAELISPFIREITSGQIQIYNEFSLQHELGSFLRRHLTGCLVQFERNVSFFFPDSSSFTKREIDISVFTPDKRELIWAIELKFPRNGQHPEQMFSFCKDIAFVEELKTAGFSKAGLLVFADDSLFWRGPTEGIYGFFRGGRPLQGIIQKPTGTKIGEVKICGTYVVTWELIHDRLKFTAIDANPAHGLPGIG